MRDGVRRWQGGLQLFRECGEDKSHSWSDPAFRCRKTRHLLLGQKDWTWFDKNSNLRFQIRPLCPTLDLNGFKPYRECQTFPVREDCEYSERMKGFKSTDSWTQFLEFIFIHFPSRRCLLCLDWFCPAPVAPSILLCLKRWHLNPPDPCTAAIQITVHYGAYTATVHRSQVVVQVVVGAPPPSPLPHTVSLSQSTPFSCTHSSPSLAPSQWSSVWFNQAILRCIVDRPRGVSGFSGGYQNHSFPHVWSDDSHLSLLSCFHLVYAPVSPIFLYIFHVACIKILFPKPIPAYSCIFQTISHHAY